MARIRQANLRILDVSEIKTVPHVPLSHPFVERLIGTVRRELLDHVPFWGARDPELRNESRETSLTITITAGFMRH